MTKESHGQSDSGGYSVKFGKQSASKQVTQREAGSPLAKEARRNKGLNVCPQHGANDNSPHLSSLSHMKPLQPFRGNKGERYIFINKYCSFLNWYIILKVSVTDS